MRTVYYKDQNQRKIELIKANGLGESLIHDDFLDENGIATNGTSGKLTFEVRDNTPDSKFIRMKELRAKLQDDSITFNELKELMRG